MKRRDKILSKIEHLKKLKKLTDILDRQAKKDIEESSDEEIFDSMVDTDLTYRTKPKSRKKANFIVTGRRKGKPSSYTEYCDDETAEQTNESIKDLDAGKCKSFKTVEEFLEHLNGL
jgi:hypothetical protein